MLSDRIELQVHPYMKDISFNALLFSSKFWNLLSENNARKVYYVRSLSQIHVDF